MNVNQESSGLIVKLGPTSWDKSCTDEWLFPSNHDINNSLSTPNDINNGTQKLSTIETNHDIDHTSSSQQQDRQSLTLYQALQNNSKIFHQLCLYFTPKQLLCSLYGVNKHMYHSIRHDSSLWKQYLINDWIDFGYSDGNDDDDDNEDNDDDDEEAEPTRKKRRLNNENTIESDWSCVEESCLAMKHWIYKSEMREHVTLLFDRYYFSSREEEPSSIVVPSSSSSSTTTRDAMDETRNALKQISQLIQSHTTNNEKIKYADDVKQVISLYHHRNCDVLNQNNERNCEVRVMNTGEMIQSYHVLQQMRQNSESTHRFIHSPYWIPFAYTSSSWISQSTQFPNNDFDMFCIDCEPQHDNGHGGNNGGGNNNGCVIAYCLIKKKILKKATTTNDCENNENDEDATLYFEDYLVAVRSLTEFLVILNERLDNCHGENADNMGLLTPLSQNSQFSDMVTMHHMMNTNDNPLIRFLYERAYLIASLCNTDSQLYSESQQFL